MRTIALAVLVLLSTSVLAADARKEAIEKSLATAVAIEGVAGEPLEARMRELGVPAVSYAVVADGRIVLAAAYGLADVREERPATAKTLFQAASISKPVAAMGVLDLVERGRLSLDGPRRQTRGTAWPRRCWRPERLRARLQLTRSCSGAPTATRCARAERALAKLK